MHTQEALGFLERQEVLDVLAILRTVANPYDEVALVGCLRGPAAWWSEDDLALLRLMDRAARLHDTIKTLSAAQASPLSAKCRAFLDRLNRWRDAAAREPMARFFARLHDDLNLRERVSVLPGGDDRVRSLEFLQARAAQFDAFRRKGIAPFVDFVQDLVDRDEELGRPPAAPAGDDVVRVMTMHKSKGLEFDVVVLPFLGRRFNFGDSRANVVWDREAGFGTSFLPGLRYGEARFAASRELVKNAIDARTRSEELRLLYVAMTRARERLVLVASARGMAERVEDARNAAPRTREELDERSAAANAPLDWMLQALSHREEFRAVSPETPRGAPGTDGLEVALVADPPAEFADAAAQSEGDIVDAQAKAWRERAADVDAMLARVRRHGDCSAVRPLRAKVAATEAKRAWEALHHELNPPAEPVPQRRTADEPAWWPASLVAAKEAAPASGRRAGTLTHRLCALADLDAIARGATAADELARLAADGYFTERETRLVRVADIDIFFRETPLGARVLANRARVRREVPFSMRLRSGEIDPDSAAPDDVLLFQGVVDLLFVDEDDRLAILDFKTDQLGQSAEESDELVAAYRPQIALYAVGIERALGRPVDEAWLHFLRIAQTERIARAAGDEWLAWLRAAYLREGSTP